MYVFLNFDNPNAPPSPLQHGWHFQDGRCRPVRHTLPALPNNLSRLVSTHNSDPIDDDNTSPDNSDSSESEADDYIVDMDTTLD